MAQSGVTPISLYYSATAAAVPLAANLTAGELALNTNDGKLYYKNSSNVVTQLAGPGLAGSFTSLAYSTTLTGGTGIVNIGSGQFYKDASGNVGIGTAAPDRRLYVQTPTAGASLGSNAVVFSDAAAATMELKQSTTENQWYSNVAMTLATNGSERIRINTSGNVGIGGTTPASNPKLSLYGGIRFLTNEAASATYTGIGSIAADTVSISTSGSERMRIDTSGNVGIGNTAANVNDQVGAIRPLLVSKADSATTIAGSQAAIVIGNSDTTTSNTSQLSFAAITGASATYYTSAAINCIFGARTNGQYPTGQLTFSTSTTLNTAPTEKMRIDTDGIVMVGGSFVARTSEAKLELTSAANTALSLYMYKTSQVEVTLGFKSSTDSNFYVGTGSTSVGTYGVYLTNTGSSWNSVSDERMKTIVEPIENASAKVATLRTVIGYFNNDTTQTRRPFLIAQDVQAVLPEAVNVQNLETGTLGMSYTDTIPLLVAAIKEQQALITSLTARIAALETT